MRIYSSTGQGIILATLLVVSVVVVVLVAVLSVRIFHRPLRDYCYYYCEAGDSVVA